MRIFKPLLVVFLAVITLASCSSVKNMAVPTMDNTAVNMIAKTGDLSEEQMNAWSYADLATDSIPGMSLDKAYEFVKNKKSQTVVVGVIDSGIDIEHEDLKDVIWTNPKEIAGNNIDDDKNGYVDDVYGWNFLGGNGVSAPENLEITRMYKAGLAKYADKTLENISASDKPAFEKFLKLKEDFENRTGGNNQQLEIITNYLDANAAVRKFLNKDTFDLNDLNLIKSEDETFQNQVFTAMKFLERGYTEERMHGYIERMKKDKSYDLEFDGRAIVGDNFEDITDVKYGNPYVIGSKDVESHGTHVSGIIAATRNNNIGLNGVANNVKIMSVRAVPDGDEYDKDVALAIRYCADNGAKVVNMSFGKSYSPHSDWVFDAIKYAASKDVLLVHAAGNDGKNIDKAENFPNDSKDKITEIADNVLTIGAMSKNYNESLPAGFSNYGKLNVDVFSPGVQIYSTIPKDKYAKFNGTSMASPNAAGIAAMVRSYYPELSASQVKHILMNSGTKVDMEVTKPGSDEKVNFQDLSVSGRVVNAYNALRLADQMVNGK